jgi:four helix bundle protein
LYGLTQQLKRAAVSVPANIAEGFRKRSRADKARYMNIAQGSLEETRYYLILAQDLGYSNSVEVLDDVDEVGRLLDAYSRALLTPEF